MRKRLGLEEPANALIQTMQQLHQRGWCDGTGGNFSVVISRDPLKLLMAPSGVNKGALTSRGLIEVDGDGDVLIGEGRASAETMMHLKIVESAQAGAVLHTHSPTATCLSRHHRKNGGIIIEGLEMLKGLRGISTHDTSITLPIIDNSQSLEELTDSAHPWIKKAPHGLLVAGHGLYAWGKDLEEAHRHVEILEFLLEVSWKELVLQSLNR
ncbi:MAG: methylthioribulose 1-phosphate dehydratase [Prochlorococcus sp.]|nr:methylthioribulose 1-phosphate dehydratase [Prochlorococcaceae cyanobacterium Fu_MAG_50]